MLYEFYELEVKRESSKPGLIHVGIQSKLV